MTRAPELRWAVAYAAVAVLMALWGLLELLVDFRMWPLAATSFIASGIYFYVASKFYRRSRTLP